MIQFCSSFVPVFKIALSLEPQGMNQSSIFLLFLGSVYIYVCVICSIYILIFLLKKLEHWNITTTTRDKPILKSGTDPDFHLLKPKLLTTGLCLPLGLAFSLSFIFKK